jgi:hypothetical protein
MTSNGGIGNDGVLWFDDDVAWFEGEADTCFAVEHLRIGCESFGGPTISLGGKTSLLGETYQ